ncbi:viable flagellar protein number 3 [Thraustotheca clavata]|uniref:Coiled-coil domain-containing protein 61 n=1 Tax=Thraustotheca clavata TaxID=74557 RepID=A0A1W0AAY5_9STRA|nr:viable flagellar protein number 3 [Thraustotheca clavata]
MDSKSIEASGTMCFHGVEYSVNIWVHREELHVQVEEESLKSTSVVDRWGGHFPAVYVEELTKKTGNFKRFYTFVNMLVSALNHKSDSVFIDLLTYSDLELYRKRKLGKSTLADSGATSAHSNNKRYLILTYAVEFDRVHYPLPLNYIDNPAPEVLQRTILRLKQSLAEARGDGGQPDKQLHALQDENNSLRLQIQQLQSIHDTSQFSDDSYKNDLQNKEYKELLSLYQQLQKDSAREIYELQAQIADLENVQANAQRYSQRIHQLERDMERAQIEQERHVSQLERQASDAKTQADNAKKQLQELQLKNKELMRQLAIARSNSTPRTKGTPSIPSSNLTAKRSSPAPTTRSKSSRQPVTDTDSHSERLYSPRPKQQPYKRFDPTAYHVYPTQNNLQLERQAKLRARSQSPQSFGRSGSVPKDRQNGYASDSSNGYQSGASNTSRRPRSRGRPTSTERQRNNDTRLASPRYQPPKKSPPAVSQKRPPSPLPPRKPKASQPKNKARTKETVKSNRKDVATSIKNIYDDSDDSELEGPSSFTDIDKRLNALQQFLQEAKRSK